MVETVAATEKFRKYFAGAVKVSRINQKRSQVVFHENTLNFLERKFERYSRLDCRVLGITGSMFPSDLLDGEIPIPK